MFADLSQADYAFNLPRSIGGHISGKLGPLSYNAAVLNSVRAFDAPGQRNFGSNVAALGRLEFDILAPYGHYETSPKPVRDAQLSVGLAVATIQSTDHWVPEPRGERCDDQRNLDLATDGAPECSGCGYYRNDN
jgi:hypothetical protein